MTADSVPTEEETPLETIVAGITIGVILAVGFGLLAVGYPYFWIAFPIGFAGVLPAAIGFVKLYERRQRTVQASDESAEDDPLAVVRDRYARGELSDEEFDHRLERLLETESLEDVASTSSRDDEPEYDLERT